MFDLLDQAMILQMMIAQNLSCEDVRGLVRKEHEAGRLNDAQFVGAFQAISQIEKLINIPKRGM